MGCDIHLHIEVKIGGEWHHYAAPNISRNYNLFAIMAGVRNYVEFTPISEPKGLPNDCTLLTKLDSGWLGSDGHSHSWLGVAEIIELQERLNQLPKPTRFMSNDLEHGILHSYLFDSSFTGWHEYPDENYHNIEDVRFVFWFDN